jgi:electron transfer flavoprotein beta subunit
VAHALGWPCVTGIKALEIVPPRVDIGGTVTVQREAAGGWEIFEIPLPAVVTVKEGLNLPRYPTVPGRLKAKRAPIETIHPQPKGNTLQMVRLKLPPTTGHRGEILGQGPEATSKLVEVLQRLGVIAS